MKLQGKVALITGTSPNICGGIAEGMAEEGAKIRLRRCPTGQRQLMR